MNLHENDATTQPDAIAPAAPGPGPAAGLTLEQYAEAKRLPPESLREWGLTTINYMGSRAVRIPYASPDGQVICTRYRLALSGDRFRFKSGDKPQLYGLDRLDKARHEGFVLIVEGESDVHTCWHHGLPAVGLPGASAWVEGRDAQHFDDIARILVVIEPDVGGQRVLEWISRSAIRDRVELVHLGDAKDVSELQLLAPEEFGVRLREALADAVPWRDVDSDRRDAERADAWASCEELAMAPDILGRLEVDLRKARLIGETRTALLLYLVVVSRLLEQPLSAVVKGPSSGGKSYVVKVVLSLFPEDSFYALTAMSDRALVYSTEPLVHRMLVLHEAASLESDWVAYLIRSLLSEGHVRYETVLRQGGDLVGVLIEREGPTGLIVTTTAVNLHPENETRMLNLSVTDTREQTKHVLRAIAENHETVENNEPWLALQRWLAAGDHEVSIPFASALAELIPPVNIRLRRDFTAVLGLIRAHALIHQASRDRDELGRIIATIDDYASVRGLVAGIIAEGIEAVVPDSVRETVAVVAGLTGSDGPHSATVKAVSQRLQLDKSTASRRVRHAIELGYLVNREAREHQPKDLVVGEPLPADLIVLPYPDRVEEELRRCNRDEEVGDPSPLRLDESVSLIQETFPGTSLGGDNDDTVES